MKTEKKLIIYAGKFELPDKNAEAQRVMANAKGFRMLGYTVIFLGISHDRTTSTNLQDTLTIHSDFECYDKPYPKSLFNWVKHITSSNELVSILEMHQNEVAAVLLYNYPAFAMYRIMQYCKRRAIKIISDCTEWYAPFTKHTRPSLIKLIDTEWRMRILNKHVDYLIAISTYLYDYYQDKVPTVRIPPLVDIDDEKWKMPDVNRQKELTILYAGSPGKKDRLDIVVTGVLKSPIPISFWVIGLNQADFCALYPEFFQVDLTKITFLGRLSHNEVIAKICQADYSCFFRDDTRMSHAGFPTKFVESITAGVPVFTNATSDIKEYADKVGSCIILDEISYPSILEGLIEANLQRNRIAERDFFDYRKYLPEFEKIVALL